MKKRRSLYSQLLRGLAVMALSGCETVETSLSDLGCVVGGSALAYQLSSGDQLATIAGATSGVAFSKMGRSKVEKRLKAAYQSGYEDAMNQNVKQQYWIIQNHQKGSESSYERKLALVPITIPEQIINGEIIQERVEYIRVERS